MQVEIKRLRPDAIIPSYQSEMAAGMDLHACLPGPMVIRPGQTLVISLGFAIYIGQPDVVAKVYPRSGLGKKGLVLANLTGVIDADYQGEMAVLAWNRNPSLVNGAWGVQENAAGDIAVNPGDRIAQLVFEYVARPQLVEVRTFKEGTKRGDAGFGSTGVAA